MSNYFPIAITNHSPAVLCVAGLNIAPRRTGHVDEKDFLDWRQRNRDKLHLIHSGPTRFEVAVHAVNCLRFREDEADIPRTKDGKYTINAIASRTGFRATVEERDFAHDFWFDREKWLREHGRATAG